MIKASSEEAASVLHGIVLQFPLYAGIYGIFKATGLTERIGQLFVSLSTTKTFPAIVYLYSGVVNYFVPSGGSKWAIEAPYLLEAARAMLELSKSAQGEELKSARREMSAKLLELARDVAVLGERQRAGGSCALAQPPEGNQTLGFRGLRGRDRLAGGLDVGLGPVGVRLRVRGLH